MTFASPLSTPALPDRSSTGPAWLRHPLAIAALSVSLIAGSLSLTAAPVTANPSQSNVPNGVYVFGESPTAGQLGTTYMVMQVSADRVTGGFYQPSSSFDCFHGEITGTEMALTVIDSYAQTAHPFALALESGTAVASSEAIAGEWVPSGFYSLPELSATDHEVLQMCSL
ncbi:MAG: hypothetical protein F6K00_08860 [Leptolyngbya sp. SIOISBB]|nr:hypothetical protein [Leptolyngbya sp. SIOISBB]